MWVRGRIRTTCEYIESIKRENQQDANQQHVSSLSYSYERNAYLVNDSYWCGPAAHYIGLKAFAELYYHRIAQLVKAEVQDDILSVDFRLDISKIQHSYMKNIAAYCTNADISPNRPTYALADSLIKSARGASDVQKFDRPIRGYFSSIPDDIVERRIVPFLSASDLRILNKTCTLFRAVGSSYVPGLIPKLFKHQRASLYWMEQQEMNPALLGDVFLHTLVTEDGQEILVDAISGRFVSGSKAELTGRWRARKGGLLCDAPGLGKTVAMLALVLRTKNMIALPERREEDDAETYQGSIHDILVEGFSARKTPPRKAKSERKPQRATHCVKTTLVVIPRPLIAHWKAQIALHCSSFGTTTLKYQVVEHGNDKFPDDVSHLDLLLVSTIKMSNQFHVEDSLFRKVVFLRAIIDEGHSLGNQTTNLTNMMKMIETERFWIVTGTPARLSDVANGLKDLHHVLQLLRATPNLAKWNDVIVNGYKQQNNPVSEHILVGLLKRVLIRHRKEDVFDELPKLERKQTFLNFGEDEKKFYNLLVSFVRSNILLTSVGKTGGYDLSLLNPKNRKQCSELVHNLRIACCGGGGEQYRLYVREKDIDETKKIFEMEPADVYQRVVAYLEQACSGQSSPCNGCGIMLPLLLITRCGHLFCVDCMNFQACPKCMMLMDPDDIAAIQPGFSLRSTVGTTVPGPKSQYIVNAVSEERINARERKLIGKKGVEIKPKFIVFSQFRHVLNLVGDHLIRAFGVDSVAEFWGRYREVEMAKFINNKVEEWVCPTCQRVNTDPISVQCEFKTRVVSLNQDGSERHITRPETEIAGYDPMFPPAIGTQVLLAPQAENAPPEHATVRAIIPCRGRRDPNAPKLFRNVDCDILLLSRDGSHGLDISCATHIFLLDLIWDAALDDQIVSRAWRLGNRAEKVIVDQLLMSDSLEELLANKTVGGSRVPSLENEEEERPEGMLSLTQNDEFTIDSNDSRVKMLLERIKIVK